jgi:two-component system, OmpR family, phosphate regulon sensor histidine kinase PhoR
MPWPFMTLLALAALVLLHVWWRSRFQRAQQDARGQIETLEQSRRQAALEVRTEQESLLNSMAEGVVLLDEAGRIELANHPFAKMFGLTGETRSRTLLEVLRSRELADLFDSLSSGNSVETELKLPGSPERFVQVHAASIGKGPGNKRGTILVFHDLTRLKQLERTRQEFVANVSHELRTPLSLIKGYAETLLDGAKDNPEVASKFLDSIDRNAERLRLLIEDLLTISELESGRLALDLQPVELHSLVRKVLNDFKSRADARQMKLLGQTPELRVRGDSRRIEQVLCNLVDNAIKYGRAEGTVTVSARVTDGGLVEVSVQDDGPGIPAEALDRIFERFYRVDKARSREQGGTGLGLSIVKHIIQSHGGRTWVDSQPGRGAAFFFTLPREVSAAK